MPVIRILEPVETKGRFETVKRLCRIINEIMRLAVATSHFDTEPTPVLYSPCPFTTPWN